jgi:hypothetical protein
MEIFSKSLNKFKSKTFIEKDYNSSIPEFEKENSGSISSNKAVNQLKDGINKSKEAPFENTFSSGMNFKEQSKMVKRIESGFNKSTITDINNIKNMESSNRLVESRKVEIERGGTPKINRKFLKNYRKNTSLRHRVKSTTVEDNLVVKNGKIRVKK